MGKNQSSLARLFISDGTTTVSLLNNAYGFGLTDWRPALQGLKEGGIFHSSPFADGRQLVDYHFDNAIESFSLTVHGADQDATIQETRNLRQLLEKARAYWTNTWQTTPVYMGARGSLETNIRYAVIKDYSTPVDANPFTTPFFSCLNPVMPEFSLFLEHGDWQDVAPGDSTCVQAKSFTDANGVGVLDFDGVDDYVQLDASTDLDDLPLADFTIEAWVLINPLIAPSTFVMIFMKEDQGFYSTLSHYGWEFYWDPIGGLSISAFYNNGGVPSASASFSGIDDLDADGLWHHVAATFELATRTFRLWVDGVEVSYDAQSTGIGTYLVDNVAQAAIGAAVPFGSGPGSYFHGSIGWLRISDNLRYTAAFTPPEQCYPSVDANTIGAWIYEGYGNIINTLLPGANINGTIYGATWDNAECELKYGNVIGNVEEETCENRLYIGNNDARVFLTHIYEYFGGIFYGNLLEDPLPYELLTNNVNPHYCYFISSTSRPHSGPFSNLVFDINIAQRGRTITWEYWNGAWIQLTPLTAVELDDLTRDRTGVNPYSQYPFSQAGVGSVCWNIPTDWVTTTINGITGYIVRAKVNTGDIIDLNGAILQQNRHVYTCNWPCIEVDEARVGGDKAALARFVAENRSGNDSATDKCTDRILVGLRSLSRGEKFTAYLNFSKYHNEDGILCHPYSNADHIVDVRSPTGYAISYTPAGAETDQAVAFFELTDIILPQYYGRYRAFMRGRNVTGAATDLRFRLAIQRDTSLDPTSQLYYLSDAVPATKSGMSNVMDFGSLTLPPMGFPAFDDFDSLYIAVFGTNLAATARQFNLFDLILIPADEWMGDFGEYLVNSIVNLPMADFNKVDIDSITRPRQSLIAQARDEGDHVYYQMVANKSGPAILQANATQKLWFFTMNTIASQYVARHEILQTVSIQKAQRYFSMRGAG